MLDFMFLGSNPTPDVEFACGSASTKSVRCSSTAKDAARLMAVVVFPTPPFWLAMAIIFPIVVPFQRKGLLLLPPPLRGRVGGGLFILLLFGRFQVSAGFFLLL